jgi:hypothetical protein
MNIPSEEYNLINSNLPDLTSLLYDFESQYYKRAFVCVFDHWLDGEEFYEIFEGSKEEVLSRKLKFEKLIKYLYANTPIYTARFRRDRKKLLSIKRVKSLELLDKMCRFYLLNEDHGDQFKFLIPEYSLVYTQNFDWTHLIDYHNENKASAFKKLLQKFDLHWLVVETV